MSADGQIRVLVVDDSAFARKVLREVLSRDPRIEVVDIARDGLEALEKIATLKPDVVTLDLVMPELDGIGVLKALPATDRPRVLVVSFSDAETELGAEALQLGALDVVKKPTALATDRMYELSGELLEKVRTLGGAKVPPLASARVEPPPMRPELLEARTAELVVVGTSTGGPQALTHLVEALPGAFPVPMVVALHIPAGYTDAIARRLDTRSAVHVVEASDGMRLSPGMVAIAPGGLQLEVARTPSGLVTRVYNSNALPYTPSVDLLFASAAKASGARVVGVVLTGMGDDGLEGARQIREAGGRILSEAPESCVIYGMPRVVWEAGLSEAEVALPQIDRAIVEALSTLDGAGHR